MQAVWLHWAPWGGGPVERVGPPKMRMYVKIIMVPLAKALLDETLQYTAGSFGATPQQTSFYEQLAVHE